MTRATSFATVLLLVQFCSSGESAGRVPDAQSDSVGGWKRSFTAGSVDASDRLVGGTEIIHLVTHNGRLYAGNGYWMDTVGKSKIPWAQVLVLDSPEGSWKVDLELGPRHLRVTILKSITFETDGNGTALDVPVSLLLAGSDHHEVGKAPVYRETNIWTRDDDENTWVKTTLQSGKRHRRSVRALHVHRDRKTGVSGQPTFGGWYPGGSYLIRYPDRSYRLKEVNGRWKPGNPTLVAVRTFALSPFSEDAGHVYFGGFDANFRDAHNTAWIFRAPVENVLRAYPDNRGVMRPSEKSEAKAAGQKGSEAWFSPR